MAAVFRLRRIATVAVVIEMMPAMRARPAAAHAVLCPKTTHRRTSSMVKNGRARCFDRRNLGYAQLAKCGARCGGRSIGKGSVERSGMPGEQPVPSVYVARFGS